MQIFPSTARVFCRSAVTEPGLLDDWLLTLLRVSSQSGGANLVNNTIGLDPSVELFSAIGRIAIGEGET